MTTPGSQRPEPAGDASEGSEAEAQRPTDAEGGRSGDARPTRPPVAPARTPPSLRPPTPPAPLRWSAGAWRLVGLGLGLAVGLTFLAIKKVRPNLRAVVAERAGDLSESGINRATSIFLFGSLAVWAVLAILALILAPRLRRASLRPRFLGVVLLLVLLPVLLLTTGPLTGGSGFALAARGALWGAAVCGLAGAVLGMAPGTWSWVRQNRGRPAAHPASAPESAPPSPTHGR